MKFSCGLLAMKCFIVLLSLVAVSVVSAGNVRPSSLIQLPRFSIRPHLNAETDITNGNIAQPGQFPYQCGLEIKLSEGYAWCGCTIISNKHVLTAAHCTDEADEVTVFLGANNIRLENEEHRILVTVPKDNIIVHEHWDPDNLINDISIITLPEAIEFNDYIQPAVLPDKDNISNYEGATVVASGWGLSSDSATAVSNELRYVEVKVMTNKLCKTYFFGSVTNDMICIDTKGKKSTCSGDSGGPLVYVENGVNYVVGTTSFGIALGCEKGWPGVFTRTTSYLDWIAANTA